MESPIPLELNSQTFDPQLFNASMVQLYRGEMQRMTSWRARLDTASHWAILLATGISTFSLSTPTLPHYILLLGLTIITMLMLMESRRYQHLHHSKWRIQLLEHCFFSRQLLCDEPPQDLSWRKQLSVDLQRPHFTISSFMATRLRLRRRYLMIFYFVIAVWLTKIFVHPRSSESLLDFYGRFAIGGLIPSWFVAVSAALFILSCTIIAATTPSEEALDRWIQMKRFESLSIEEQSKK